MAGQNIQKFSHAASSPHCSPLHYRPSQDELLFYLLLIIELCTITVVQVDKYENFAWPRFFFVASNNHYEGHEIRLLCFIKIIEINKLLRFSI